MAARPIGGHKNLWNGKMAATEPLRQFCDRKSQNGSVASRACGGRIWPSLSKVYCEMDTFCAKSGAALFDPGRGFRPRLAKFIAKWTHFAQNLAQPFLSPVTFSEVLAGLKISCGRGFWPSLGKVYCEMDTFYAKSGAALFVPRPRIWPSLSKVYCEMDTFCAKSGAALFVPCDL